MKNLPLPLLLVSSLAMAATPVSARTGAVVNFSYKASELATEQGRLALVERMTAATYALCSGSQSEAYPTVKKCRLDIEKQFIAAIGDPSLVATYKGDAVKIARNGL